MKAKYKKLFEKGYIGRLEIKNRGVMVPMGTDFANHDGTASMRLIRYYEERAAGSRSDNKRIYRRESCHKRTN